MRPEQPAAAFVGKRILQGGNNQFGGTLHFGGCHAAAFQVANEPGTERVDSLRPHFERDLHRRGVEEPGRAAEWVVSSLTNSISDDRGRWILGPHAEAKSEYRMRTRDRTLVIDRVFTDAGGKRWVVDFKTSSHEGGKVEAFLDEQQKRYAAQLDAYAAALDGARRGLYFPLLKGWREW